jgi:hypothetical protein
MVPRLCSLLLAELEWLAVMGWWLSRGTSARLCTHADVCDLGAATRLAIWRCSGCSRGEGPGAKLDTAQRVSVRHIPNGV